MVNNSQENNLLYNVEVILLSPSHAGNVGSIARLCRNFEVPHLTLINPKCDPKDLEALKLARPEGHEILADCMVKEDLKEALSHAQFVIGFSKPLSEGRLESKHIDQIIPLLTPDKKVAFLFGRESSGLTNEELELCSYICEIPSSPRMHSLNLSHAVAIALARLYEVYNKGKKRAYYGMKEQRLQAASFELLESLYGHLETALEALGFTKAGNPQRMIERFRQIFSKAQINYYDVQLMRGICSKILNKIKNEDRHHEKT
jgi:TrmH family RNA methyltransferase